MTRLSVVIPTYNRAALVEHAVQSVLEQESPADIELVVVDDGSSDGTREVLAPYASRIKYIHQANAGMNVARNRGIAESSGELVAFLDSDDIWLPFKARLQVAVLDALDSVGFAFSNFFIWRGDERIPNGLGTWMAPGRAIDEAGVLETSSRELGLDVPSNPFAVTVCDIYGLSLVQPVVLPSTAMVRRAVLEDLGPLPEDNWMCGDWEYFAQASRLHGAAYMDVETALNRSHDDSVRLMRRDLADRTRQRIESIRRTWKSDADFMARRSTEVLATERRECIVLLKQACYGGDRNEARRCLAEIAALPGGVPLESRLLSLICGLPGGVKLIGLLRRAVGSAGPAG